MLVRLRPRLLNLIFTPRLHQAKVLSAFFEIFASMSLKTPTLKRVEKLGKIACKSLLETNTQLRQSQKERAKRQARRYYYLKSLYSLLGRKLQRLPS